MHVLRQCELNMLCQCWQCFNVGNVLAIDSVQDLVQPAHADGISAVDSAPSMMTFLW